MNRTHVHPGSVCLVALLPLLFGSAGLGEMAPLVERLGLASDSKVLIVTADDVGMNHTTTQVAFELLRQGSVTGAQVMVPCPWFPMVTRFASDHPQPALGQHVVLTSEWPDYRWRPILGTDLRTLVDDHGFFHRRPSLNVSVQDADREARAQVQAAIAAGIDVMAVDSHMLAAGVTEHLARMLMELAHDYRVPARVAYEAFRQGPDGVERLAPSGTAGVRYADELAVVHPDRLYLGWPARPDDAKDFWTRRLRSLEPGYVSELYMHPGASTEEMKTTATNWRSRTADSDFFASEDLRAMIREEEIILISYRELRQLQRGLVVSIPERFGW